MHKINSTISEFPSSPTGNDFSTPVAISWLHQMARDRLLGAFQFRVAIMLALHANERGFSHITYQELARLLRNKPERVQKAVNGLTELGHLAVERTGMFGFVLITKEVHS